MMVSNSISVLIRTSNSSKRLEDVLSKLDFVEGDELIIVDSGSTDATLEIASKYGARIILVEGPFNYSKSLNLGFQAARNPWVLVLSSHCVPAVADLMQKYRDEIVQFAPDVVVGYGPSDVTGQSPAHLDPAQSRVFGKDDPQAERSIGGNANAIYHRSAWEQWPFDEMLRTGEDVRWIRGMLERGFRFCHIPQARGKNKYSASLAYMFRKGFDEARAARTPDCKPMKIRHFVGIVKRLALKKMQGEIDFGDVARGTAKAAGVYYGSRKAPAPFIQS